MTLEIVRSAERCDPSRCFETWARGVARRVALASLRKQARQPVALEEDVLETIGEELDRFGSEAELEIRKEALAHCLETLSDSNRQIVRLHYFENLPYGELARVVGRTVGALYVAVNRIHAALQECVRRRLRTP